MTESEFTRRLCRGLERLGAITFAVVGGSKGGGLAMQRPGWPDRYVHHARWCGWLEFKSATGKLRADQRCVLRDLNRRRPGSAYVVRSMDVDLGVVEDEVGVALATFDGTADELLAALVHVAEPRRDEELSSARAVLRGEYWTWQGNDEDHLESLTCRVVIGAGELRAALEESREAGYDEGLIDGRSGVDTVDD